MTRNLMPGTKGVKGRWVVANGLRLTAVEIAEGKGLIDDLRGRRPKRVTLQLRDPVAPIVLPGATIVARQGNTVVLDYLGDAAALLAALAALPITDVRIEEPGLDEIFLSYYRSEAAE